jgi:putative cell wall-binding protein/chitodextrinase
VAYVLVRAIGLGVVEGAVGTAYTYTDGKYIVSGLPAGEYAVEFDTAEYNLEPESIVDLAPEFYSEKWVADQADPVTVVASGNTTGIDAGLDQLGTPRIIVSGVEDGGVYREVTAQVEFVDAVSSSITLDGLPYTSGTLIATHGPHVLHAEAEGMTGLTADLTITFSIDAESPSAPTGLTATPISGSRIDLEWNAASDASGIAKYLVYVDGESAPRCEVTSLSCSVVGLTPETPYSFYVVAVDGVGNLSDPSATVEATTLSTPNSPPVLAPVGDKSVSVFSTLSFTATATDDDGDALMFSLGAGAPTGASITSGGLFTWTPTADQGPETYLLTIIVSDGTDTDSETINVTVTVDSALPDGAIRVAGSNRYATSVEASKRGFPDGAKTVVIAPGSNWPDALGGSALAGAVDGPLLLTKPDALPSEVSTEIKRLGATKAYILGSTAAVSSAVETQLKGLGLTVVRKGGSNRYETARMVADETIRLLGSSYEGHAFVATGLNFPDATGAAPVAAALGRPILLANVTAGTVSLPPAVNKVVILGSTAAVPSKVETYLDTTLGSANVDRLAGANRYDTAARAAQLGVNAGMRWDGTGLATGLNFPDALSGGAMLGKLNSVMLLTRPDLLSGEARTKLYNNRAVIDTLFIFGDTNAVSSAVEVAAKAAATVK